MSYNTTIQAKEMHQVTVSVQSVAADFAKLKLYNAQNELVISTYGKINVPVEKGLYVLTVELNEYIDKQYLRVDKDVSLTISPPATNSVIPSEYFSTTHEYYSYTAQDFSQQETCKVSHGGNSSLFLFFRYPSKEEVVPGFMGRFFYILDSERQRVCKLEGEHVAYHAELGYLAFSGKLPEGLYYLVYKGKEPREVPVYLYPNWQTQLFLMFQNGAPVFKNMAIVIGEPFSRTMPDNGAVDALLQKFYNGVYFVPEELVERTAYEKWQNPILAIIACYMYFMGSERKYDDLFKIIFNNLRGYILHDEHSPDMVALRLLKALHYGESIPTTPLTAPCMFAIGVRAFIKQSITHPELIPAGSLMERIVPNMKYDMVYTSFSPLGEGHDEDLYDILAAYPDEGAPQAEEESKEDSEEQPPRRSTFSFKSTRNKQVDDDMDEMAAEESEEEGENRANRSVTLQLDNSIFENITFDKKNDWVTASLFEYLHEMGQPKKTRRPPEPLNVASIAEVMGITPNIVRQKLRFLNSGHVQLNAVGKAVLGNKAKDLSYATGIVKEMLQRTDL